MSTNPDPHAAWARQQAMIEKSGVDAYVHPGDRMDIVDTQYNGDDLGEALRRLLLLCLPKPGVGQRVRGGAGGNAFRLEVGYRRMCVLTFITAPVYYHGMTKRGLARHLGISYRALMGEFVYVRSLIANQEHNTKGTPAPGKVCRSPGPSRAPRPIQVPRDAERSSCVVKSKLGEPVNGSHLAHLLRRQSDQCDTAFCSAGKSSTEAVHV